MPCAAGLCATFGPPLYSAARGRRRRRQSKGSDQNKILKASTFGASNLPVEGASPSQNDNPPRRKKNATTRRSARRWHCWFRRVKMQRPLCDLGLGQERSTIGPNGSTRLVIVSLQLIQFWGNNFWPTPTYQHLNGHTCRTRAKKWRWPIKPCDEGWEAGFGQSIALHVVCLLTTPENQNRVYSSHVSLHLAPETKSSRSKDITSCAWPNEGTKEDVVCCQMCLCRIIWMFVM